MENKSDLVYGIVHELLGTERENFDLNRDQYVGNYDNFCQGLSQREFDKLWYIDVWIPGSLVQVVSRKILRATEPIPKEKIQEYIENSYMAQNLIKSSFIRLLLATVRRQ